MVKLFLAALAMTGALSGFQWRALNYSTPSTSMAPTLNPGDYLLFPVFFKQTPQRGDIVVFDVPDGSGGATAYVKRVVGLPGDKVQYVDGALRIAGVEVARTAVERPGGLPPEVAVAAKAYRETVGDAAYVIIEAEEGGFLDNTPEYAVQEGRYFMLGDNRDNSTDSRIGVIGNVSAEAIVGRVCWVFRFPVSLRNVCAPPSQPAANSLSE